MHDSCCIQDPTLRGVVLVGTEGGEVRVVPSHGPILVVDDDENICQVLRDALVADGFAAQTATSAFAALQTAPPPSLVILDLNLGDYAGELLIDRLSRLGSRRVPIVAISGDKRGHERLQGHSGVVAFLHKPFDLNDLLGICRALLRPRVSGFQELREARGEKRGAG